MERCERVRTPPEACVAGRVRRSDTAATGRANLLIPRWNRVPDPYRTFGAHGKSFIIDRFAVGFAYPKPVFAGALPGR
jgi:hypothetical protein